TGSFAQKKASLHITAGYCDRGINSITLPALTVRFHDQVIKTTEASSGDRAVLDKLDTGTYVVSYSSIFCKIVDKTVFIGSYKKHKLNICIDYFDTLAETYVPVIDQLKEGEEYSVHVVSGNCAHVVADSFSVRRTNGNYDIDYKGRRTRLSAYEIEK